MTENNLLGVPDFSPPAGGDILEYMVEYVRENIPVSEGHESFSMQLDIFMDIISAYVDDKELSDELLFVSNVHPGSTLNTKTSEERETVFIVSHVILEDNPGQDTDVAPCVTIYVDKASQSVVNFTFVLPDAFDEYSEAKLKKVVDNPGRVRMIPGMGYYGSAQTGFESMQMTKTPPEKEVKVPAMTLRDFESIADYVTTHASSDAIQETFVERLGALSRALKKYDQVGLKARQLNLALGHRWSEAVNHEGLEPKTVSLFIWEVFFLTSDHPKESYEDSVRVDILMYEDRNEVIGFEFKIPPYFESYWVRERDRSIEELPVPATYGAAKPTLH